MSFASVDHAAGLLADLRVRTRGAVPLTDLPPACRPTSLLAAYEIQARLRELLANRRPGPQTGWKIGCTTPVMQDYLKIPHPCAGTLYTDSTHHGDVSIAAADYFMLGLECEIAVRLGRDLPLLDTLYDRESMAEAVSGVMAAIEIVEHRFVDFRRTGVASLVADDFFSAGCVLGPEVAPASAGSLAGIRGGFAVDGAAPETTGTGAEILGHPLTALAWLADHAARLGTPLRAGQVVTLGSVVKTVYPEPGQTVAAEFDRLPPVRIDIL